MLGIGQELACNGSSWKISLKRLMSYSRYWTGTSLQWRLMRGNIIKKRLMSYSRYWTGTSLQWRPMRGNIIKKINVI